MAKVNILHANDNEYWPIELNASRSNTFYFGAGEEGGAVFVLFSN